MRFQDLFHSPPGVLFAFPSRYLFTIGQSRVFSLGGWSPHLQTGFLVSRLTRRYPIYFVFRLRGYHPFLPIFPDGSAKHNKLLIPGLFRVRSPLLAESRLISFPLATEM